MANNANTDESQEPQGGKPELLPCPFCGSDAEYVDPMIKCVDSRVNCTDIWCVHMEDHAGKGSCIKAWNIRAPIPSGEVNLSLTVGELDIISGSLISVGLHDLAPNGRDSIKALLTKIRSQTKGDRDV